MGLACTLAIRGLPALNRIFIHGKTICSARRRQRLETINVSLVADSHNWHLKW